MPTRAPTVVELFDVPESYDAETVYRLLPKKTAESFSRERIDRNIGWITTEEQEALFKSITISIAGCGGMGGQIAEKMLRLGIGTIRIADPEAFDVSNINRQFAATKNTVGKSKALETARMLREISDDTVIEVYPQGVTANMLDLFLHNSSIIIDEIEFWNIGSCVLLHKKARARGVPILNGLTVGFAAYLHLFTPESMPVEEMLNISLREALRLENAIISGRATTAECDQVMDAAIMCFIPEMPVYYSGSDRNLHETLTIGRLRNEGKAPIIATNPPFAGGLVADQALLHILKELNMAERQLARMPCSPGYVMVDAATLSMSVVQERELS